MDIKYYKSCSVLPIYNFYKIVDENNLNFLVKGYEDGDNDVEDKGESEFIIQEILEEYSELTSSKEILVGLNSQILITEYEFERDFLKQALDVYNETEDLEVLSILSEFGFDIDEAKDFDAFLNIVISRIKGLNNKIRINKVKYANRFKQEIEEIKRNLDKEALMLEMSLELGREIDTLKTSVSKWVNMINVSKEKRAQVEKIRNK